MKLHESLANNLQASIASDVTKAIHLTRKPRHFGRISYSTPGLLKAEGNEAVLSIDPLLAELDAAIAQRRET